MGVIKERIHIDNFPKVMEETFEKFTISNNKHLIAIFSPFWDKLICNTDFVALFGAIFDTVGERVSCNLLPFLPINVAFLSQRHGPGCLRIIFSYES